MIKVLIVEEPNVNAVTWWRFFSPIAEIHRLYPGKFSFKFLRKVQDVDLYTHDLFILSRPNDSVTLNLVKKIKQIGRSKIILDIDDAITNLPFYHDQAAYHNARIGVAREIWSLVDWFWVSTEQLLYECDCLNNGTVIPNAVRDYDLPLKPADDTGRWMWRGRGLQKEDVYQAGASFYNEIKHIPSQFTFWGVMPNLPHGNNVVLQQFEDDIESYFAKLKTSQFNVVWKPLVPCLFNDAKSNIAWIEATMCGGVCLTNYAGKKSWEFATNTVLPYKDACELWTMSIDEILKYYNLEYTAKMRVQSIEQIL